MKGEIECRNLSFSFSDTVVFENFNWKVNAGEKVALTGPSGRGKSTLLNLLVGFLPQHSGQIYVGGMALTPDNIHSIRQQIAWLPQETALHFETAKEAFFSVFNFRANQQFFPSKTEINKLFDIFELKPAVLEKKFSELSGGQRQRLMVASVLLSRKPIIILDEPNSALDERLKKIVTDRVLSCPATIIASVHDPYWMNRSNKIKEL